MTVLIFTLISALCVILALAARVLIAFAINSDARARNLKSTTLFSILAFFFPVIVGIIYACTRNNAEPNEKYCAACNLRFDGSAKKCPSCNSASLMPVLPQNSKELVKRGITLCVIGVIVFVLSFGAGAVRTAIAVRAGLDIADNYSEEDIEKWAEKFVKDYTEDEEDSTTEEEESTDISSILGNLTYYDRNGKAYDAPDKVPFYDKDGNEYHFKQDKTITNAWFEDKDGNKLETKKCFVDKDGYFVYDSKGEITLSDDMFDASDKNGNKYVPASLVIWNKDGTMIPSVE